MDNKQIKAEIRFILFNILENKTDETINLLKELLVKLDGTKDVPPEVQTLYNIERKILQNVQVEESDGALQNVYSLLEFMKKDY